MKSKRKRRACSELGSERVIKPGRFHPNTESVDDFYKRISTFMQMYPIMASATSPEAAELRRNNLLLKLLPYGLRCAVCRSLRLDSRTAVKLPTANLLAAIRANMNAIRTSSACVPAPSAAAALPSDSLHPQLQELHQRPGESVADFVYELEKAIAQCGYDNDTSEAVAKDRLVIGLNCFKVRAALLEALDRPEGASFDQLRYIALTLDAAKPDDRCQEEVALPPTPTVRDLGTHGAMERADKITVTIMNTLSRAFSPQDEAHAPRLRQALSAFVGGGLQALSALWKECPRCRQAVPSGSTRCSLCGEVFQAMLPAGP